MLSLPYLPPRDDLWSASPFRPLSSFPSDPTSSNQGLTSNTTGVQNSQHAAHLQAQQQQQGQLSRAPGLMQPVQNPLTSPLMLLLADEAQIDQRKQNVRRFGANWLRPPGVAKTYQARLDEEMERREQAELARREAVMAELTAAEDAQRLAAQGPEVVVVAEDGDQDGGAGEVDLDADVPDADADVEASEGDDEGDSDDDVEDEDDEEEEDEENDVAGASHFNEESLLEGSLVGGDGLPPGQTQGFLDAEDAELDGRAQDLRDLGGAVDLDGDIPEAGSYEHTDTDQDDSEDDSSSDIDNDDNVDAMDTSFASVRPGRSARTNARSDGRQQLLRSSAGPADRSFIGLGSSETGIEDSDSPVLARAGHSSRQNVPRGNAWRERMMRARGGDRD